MKRWMVLLIIFALMGGWIVMSGCAEGGILTEDGALCMACFVKETADFICSWEEGCMSGCLLTCADCSWINDAEFSDNPLTWCGDCGWAFVLSCSETANEQNDYDGPDCSNAG